MSSSYKQFVFIYFLLATFLLFAQNPAAIHLTSNQGLPDKEFYNVLEDDNGFIWLTADKGLYRYDGNEYKLFTHPEQVGLSVFNLNIDNDNTIWFSDLSGQLFKVKDNQVELVFNYKKYFGNSLPHIILYNDKISLFNGSKIIIFDEKLNKVTLKINQNNEFGMLHFSPIIYNNSIYFGNNKGEVFKITKNLNVKKTAINLHINKYPFGYGTIKKIDANFISISHNNITNKPIFNKFSLTNKFSSSLLTSDPKIDGFYHDLTYINNDIYVSTTNGVFVCALKDNALIVKKHLFPNEPVSDVMKDSKGNLWFTTINNGIYVIPNNNLTTEFNAPFNNEITKMYLGKRNELLLTDFNQKELYRLQTNTQKSEIITFNKKKDIKYMFYNKANKSYMVTTFGSKYHTVKKGELINEYIDAEFSTTKDHFFIDQNNILLASNNRIAKLSINSISKEEFITDFELYIRAYSCFYNPSKKESYFGTTNGFFVFDEHFNKKEILLNNKSIYIKDIVSVNNGDIWCMSFKNGIYKIVNNKIVKHYKAKDGLFTNLNSFMKAYKNTLWIANNHGLQQLNTLTNTFQNITKNEGVPSYDFTGLEILNNKVYASTTKQVLTFNPNKIFNNRNTKQFEPYFTNISVNNKNQDLKTSYTLPYNENKLDIAFNTNGFLSSTNVKYKYRLIEDKSENKKWENLKSSSNVITYNQLSEGDYTFQLKGVENGKETTVKELNFTVKGIFYKQGWFYFLISLAVISLFWYYFKTKNKQFQEKQELLLEKQNKELENIYLQLESLRSQMNPHFIFNALNSIQDYIIKNEKKLARTFLVKFSRLIRMYLEHSQSESVSISEEFSALKLYLELEKVRFEDTLNYEIFIDNNIETKDLKIPTFLIQPYVENAIKHGLLHKLNNRNLEIKLNLNENKSILICSIKDNGIGRIDSAKINAKRFKYKSFSTKANEKRIHLINKTRKKPIRINIEDLYNEHKISEGTLVIIQMPIENK